MNNERPDVCIAVSGSNADLLLPLCIETMKRHVDMGGITLHLVDKHYGGSVSEYIKRLGDDGFAVVHDMPDQPPPLNGCDSVPADGFAQDAASTCQWMVDNCGEHEFVFLCHFDVMFHGDIFRHYKGAIDRGVGQVGEHSSGIVGYRRMALKQCHVGFAEMSHFKVTEDHTGAKKIRAINDDRGERELLTLNAFDTSELLELNIRYRHWMVIAPKAGEFDNLFTHSRSGSGYMGPNIDGIVRQNAMAMLKAHNIKPII